MLAGAARWRQPLLTCSPVLLLTCSIFAALRQKSGRLDSNQRPRRPERRALNQAELRPATGHAPNRTDKCTYPHRQINPAGCAVSRVLSHRRGGSPRRRRRLFIWTRRHRRAPPIVSGSGLPAGLRPEPRLTRCLALHPVGFTVPADSRRPRCALTAPFHPYPPSPKLTWAVCFLWHFPYPGPAQM